MPLSNGYRFPDQDTFSFPDLSSRLEKIHLILKHYHGIVRAAQRVAPTSEECPFLPLFEEMKKDFEANGLDVSTFLKD